MAASTRRDFFKTSATLGAANVVVRSANQRFVRGANNDYGAAIDGPLLIRRLLGRIYRLGKPLRGGAIA